MNEKQREKLYKKIDRMRPDTVKEYSRGVVSEMNDTLNKISLLNLSIPQKEKIKDSLDLLKAQGSITSNNRKLTNLIKINDKVQELLNAIIYQSEKHLWDEKINEVYGYVADIQSVSVGNKDEIEKELFSQDKNSISKLQSLQRSIVKMKNDITDIQSEISKLHNQKVETCKLLEQEALKKKPNQYMIKNGLSEVKSIDIQFGILNKRFDSQNDRLEHLEYAANVEIAKNKTIEANSDYTDDELTKITINAEEELSNIEFSKQNSMSKSFVTTDVNFEDNQVDSFIKSVRAKQAVSDNLVEADAEDEKDQDVEKITE